MIDHILIALGVWLLNKGHAVLFVMAKRRGCEYPMATVRGATIRVLMRQWWIDDAGQLVPPVLPGECIVFDWPASDCGDPSGLPVGIPR